LTVTARQRSGRPAGQVRVGAVENCLSPAPTRRRRNYDSEVGEVLTVALGRLTEREFQDRVVDLARQFDWLVVHHGGNQHRRAYYDTTGFPDLLMISPQGTVLFREVKTDTGKLTALQSRWGARLTDRAADWAVWRPKHWPEIVTTLSGGRAVAQ